MLEIRNFKKRYNMPTAAGFAGFIFCFTTLLFTCFYFPVLAEEPIDQNEYRVKTGDFSQTLVLTGNLQARQAEHMMAPMTDNWQIQIKWMVKEGDYVKPGDPVVRFDNSNITADIENLELNLRDKKEQKKQKTADYANQKLELELAEKQAEVTLRQKELDAAIPKGIISDQQYEQNQLELQRSTETLKKAQMNKQVTLSTLESELQRLEIDIKEAQLNLEKYEKSMESLTLIAKGAGAVVYADHPWLGRKIQVGETVQATWNVASIPEINSLQVEAWVNETHIHFIKTGQMVDIFPDAYPDKCFKGTIKDVLNNAEKVNLWGKAHYFNVIIALDALDFNIMKPGMSVKCIVQTATIPKALLIPVQMAYFDGRAFKVKPKEKEPLVVSPLGFNEFYLALSPDNNEKITAGTLLEPITPDVPRD
ncbi:MAG TPA: efflux RND transporter periplasmic adaptor subunit [Candidatus Deferrimicrobium sp.]|nr:efflux RND transporter periplasmic adaptor subunit [Candidatus Deferrimicrobium sp.]